MFREMRRKKQLLSEEESIKILNEATAGVLAVSGDDGYPYAVPMSYVYYDGKIIFHGAKAGHRFDSVKKEPKCSFCVTAQDEIHPELYTTFFKSVIVFGKIRIVEDESEIRRYTEILAEKYNPTATAEFRDAEIDRFFNALCIYELTAEHITGKQCIELVKQ